MKVSAIAGIVLLLIGLLWIFQGVGTVKGSGMSGHGQYAVLGAVVAVLGAGLLLWAWRMRHKRS